MKKCSKGKCRLRCNNEYTPKAAAANTISTMTAVNPAPNLFCFAAWGITEPLDFTRDGGDSWGVGVIGRATHRVGDAGNPPPGKKKPGQQKKDHSEGMAPQEQRHSPRSA